MAFRKITTFSKPVSALEDRPRMSAADLKAWFDSNSTNEVKSVVNELIDMLSSLSGAAEIGVNVEGIAEQTVYGVLVALKTLIDDRYTVNQIDTRLEQKFDKDKAQDLVKTINVDTTTGIITVTKYDGTTQRWDTALEKVALDVRLDGTEFVLTLADGTEQRVGLSAFIDTYNFLSTSSIAANIAENGSAKNISFTVRDGSITKAMMDQNLLNEIVGYVETAVKAAESAATSEKASLIAKEDAQSSADEAFTSETNSKQSEENAFLYMEEARKAAISSESSAVRAEEAVKRAESIAGGEFLVKADVVNNLTVGGTEKVLSAEQGKILNEQKAPLNNPIFIGNPLTPDLTDASPDGQIVNKKSLKEMTDIDYSVLSFDTSVIVDDNWCLPGNSDGDASPILGQGILGQIILD